MKLYDKIYVSCHGLESIGEIALNQGIENKCVYVKEVSNVLVLTIEELREMYKAAISDWVESANGDFLDDEIEEDFRTYLTSKGIHIP